jgi:hypothetical protein
MVTVWQASNEVMQLVDEVKNKHHHDRIGAAKIAVCFADSKPFVKGRFNFGKVSKFSPLAKLWHANQGKYDFLSILCADAWHGLLNSSQREALVDLHLTRCSVDYEPKCDIDAKGKKHPVKDGWGRIQYSDEMKFDDEGNPKWIILPLDLHVLTDNVLRYGPWCEEILEFKEAVVKETVISTPSIEENPYWQHVGDG